MRHGAKTPVTFQWLLAGTLLLTAVRGLCAQISPAEIPNPRLKAAEAAYLSQLETLNHDISALKFPFPFQLSRYVGLDPVKQGATDTRGLEFVYYQSQLLLKISGNYKAAYNAEQLTDNERAGRTFTDVILPALQLVTKEIPPDVTCDGIGFEIAYHVRSANHNFDYEGKEILVVVFNRADTFAFPAASAADRQEILNRSQVYLDGVDFGLAPNERGSLNVDALARSVPREPPPVPATTAEAANVRSRLAVSNPSLLPPYPEHDSAASTLPSAIQPGSGAKPVAKSAAPAAVRAASAAPASPAASGPPLAPPTPGDVERLQSQYQSQLDALAKIGVEKFHFVSYAPPSLGVFRNRMVLQISMRNTLHFAKDSTSIYKRAAQSFDLFLAAQLKDLVDQFPADASFESLDISVLNQFSPEPHLASEAIEYICPLRLVRQFVDADITNQQLLDQSVVLVNGERIALNLQLVE